MKPEEYMQRNLLGFEGDTKMKSTIEEIVEAMGIDTIIETGTFKGGTTKVFSQMKGIESVHTIEISDEHFADAEKYLSDSLNVVMYKGSSEKVLRNVIPHLLDKKVLFFADAHWSEACPLLEELKEIADQGMKPVILIHDFKVPGTSLGFDSYNGQDFELEWVEPSLKEIYGEGGYHTEYNDPNTALGARRGVLFVFPKG